MMKSAGSWWLLLLAVSWSAHTFSAYAQERVANGPTSRLRSRSSRSYSAGGQRYRGRENTFWTHCCGPMTSSALRHGLNRSLKDSACITCSTIQTSSGRKTN